MPVDAAVGRIALLDPEGVARDAYAIVREATWSATLQSLLLRLAAALRQPGLNQGEVIAMTGAFLILLGHDMIALPPDVERAASDQMLNELAGGDDGKPS